jgi:hypothetical protein
MEGKEFLDEMESHQYEDIYQSDDVPFQDLSRGIAKKLVYYGIGLFVVVLILSFIIKIPREINLAFELKGGLNETIFQYPELVYIEDFYVQANDSILKADSLVKITSAKIVSYIEEYETWSARMELYETGKKEADFQSIELLKSQIDGLKNEIQKVENEKRLAVSAGKKETKNLQLQVENSENQHKRNSTLHDQGVISDSDFEISLQKVQVAEQELISTNESYALQVAEIESKLQQLTSSYDQLHVEVEKQQAMFDYELATARKNFDLASKKIALNYGPFSIDGNSIILLSPVNGQVSLRTESEHKVPSGEILLRIKTDSLSYYAYAEAGAKDIGHIKTGTKAVLKYKSFPHYYYGTMRAEVLSVSYSPAENGNFPVKLLITQPGKLKTMVTKGMTGTASFVVEEKSIFEYILRAFLKVVTVE